MKSLAIFSLLFCILPVVANEFDESTHAAFSEDAFNIQLDPERAVTFYGKVDVNGNTGGAGGIMYPGANAGVFLASIVLHSAIAGSAEKKRLSAEQVKANRVLLGYQTYIDKIDVDFIKVDNLQLALEREVELYFGPEFGASKWSIQSRPVFFMTPKQKSLILYSQFGFEDLSLPKAKPTKKRPERKPLRKSKKSDPNKKIIVIVSNPSSDSSPAEFWLREKGENFNLTVKSLYKESLLLALRNHSGYLSSPDSKQVTVRYLEDGEKKIERGAIIIQTCERTLFETLSGEIKSVPNMNFTECSFDENRLEN